jgi:putative protease
MHQPELLSPAGNFEKLKLALAYGADAVYGGVSHFSLRIRSGKEFTYETFEKAVTYTHAQGKKIYVTINGFPFSAQIELLKKHILTMAAMRPDAFIVATPGVVKLARELAPEIPLHLSTQANVLNYLDAQVYWDLGVKRIVAAREIGLKDLALIKQHVPGLELEVFIHGSMCFAYSGRCLISSVQSGRVPNRGSCANDCRFPYTLYAQNEEDGTLFRIEEDDAGTHIMNAKDLNLANYVEEIIKSGVVDALKIEGRTKSPYYVATTAKAYREAIDDTLQGVFVPEKYTATLATTKNRGFSDGYLVHRPFEKHQTQNHETSIVEGTRQVVALVEEGGEMARVKGTIMPKEWYEVVLPAHATLPLPCENDTGALAYDEGGKLRIAFTCIKTEKGKVLEAVHSGYTQAIALPAPLPPFSFLLH